MKEDRSNRLLGCAHCIAFDELDMTRKKRYYCPFNIEWYENKKSTPAVARMDGFIFDASVKR